MLVLSNVARCLEKELVNVCAMGKLFHKYRTSVQAAIVSIVCCANVCILGEGSPLFARSSGNNRSTHLATSLAETFPGTNSTKRALTVSVA